MRSYVAGLTSGGENLVSEVLSSGSTLEVTHVYAGAGTYLIAECTQATIGAMTALRTQKNRYPVTGVSVASSSGGSKTFCIRTILYNYNSSTSTAVVAEDYRVTELGIFARVKNSGNDPILFAVVLFPPDPSDAVCDLMPAYDSAIGPVHILEELHMILNSSLSVEVDVSGAAYSASDGEALETRVAAVEDGMVDKTTPAIAINTAAASSTVDGKLYAAITALGWAAAVISDGVLGVKKTLTSIMEMLKKHDDMFVADDVFRNNTSGQTHNYTLASEGVYLLVVNRMNSSTVSGVYLIMAHNTQSSITALSELPSATGTVSLSTTALSVTCAVNYTRITIIKLGG